MNLPRSRRTSPAARQTGPCSLVERVVGREIILALKHDSEKWLPVLRWMRPKQQAMGSWTNSFVPDHWLGHRKLAFLGNSFEGLDRTFDPVLTVVAIRRKQANDFISTGCGRTRNIARRKVNRRSNREFVFQRPLHHANSRLRATVPAASTGQNAQIFL